MSKVYCRYCGKQIDEDATFCTHCGNRQTNEGHKGINLGKVSKIGTDLLRNTSTLFGRFVLFLKTFKFRRIHLGKWGKRIILTLITAIVFLCLYALAGWIYYDYYLPHHYESLYEEGMKDVNKADEIALELFDVGYYHQCETKAIEVLTNSAEQGNVNSMVLLGRFYKGYNIKKGFEDGWNSRWQKSDSFDKSSYWYLQAAKKGNAEAQGELGHNYKYGFGVKQDFDKAIYWTKQGADNGDAVAQWRMGNLYASGLAYYWGYFTDYQIWWYTGNGFVAKDNPNAHLDRQYIANMKSKEPEQVFLAPNIKKAKQYWILAANQGFQQAKNSLEKIYEGDD